MSNNQIIKNKNIVYLLKTKDNKMFKIGKTDRVDTNRIENLNSIWNFDLEESYLVFCNKNKELERTLHYLFNNHNVKGLKGDGSTEFFDMECFDEVRQVVETFSEFDFEDIEIVKYNKELQTKPIKKKNTSKKPIKEKEILFNHSIVKHKKLIFLKNEMTLNQRKMYNFFINEINEYCKELNKNIELIDYNKEFEFSLNLLQKITGSTNKTTLIKSLNFFKNRLNQIQIKFIKINKLEDKVTIKFGNDVLRIPFEEKGFIKIDIDTMIALKGKHSLTIYEILKSYDYGKRSVPVISLVDFKELMGVNDGYRNNLIKHQIIDPSIKEIQKNTTLKITYKMLKEGRELTHIQFKFFNEEDKLISQSNEVDLLNKLISQSIKLDNCERKYLQSFKNKLIKRNSESVSEDKATEKEIEVQNQLDEVSCI